MNICPFLSHFLPFAIFLLSVPSPFVSSVRTTPFTGSQLANEVAKAFLYSVHTWDTSIFGVGRKEGEDRYKINLDSLDRMKYKFRVPMPPGKGLEKLLRAYRVEPIRETVGMTKGSISSEQVLAPPKLMELMEKLGNVLVTDKALRARIDKYDRKRAQEAARRAAMMPRTEDPQTTANRRTWPKVDGSALDKAPATAQANDMGGTRLLTSIMETDGNTPRWAQRMNFSRKDVERSFLESESDSDLGSPTSVLPRTRQFSRVNILDEDVPPRRPFERSSTPHTVQQRTSTTTTTTTTENDGRGRRTVQFGEVSVVEPAVVSNSRRTEVRTETRHVEMERTSERINIVDLDLMDTSEFLEKSLGYFVALNSIRDGVERGVRRMCYALKAFDPMHQRLNSVLATPSVAEAFAEFKNALIYVGMNTQPELRLVEKSIACAYDLALIFELAQFTKDLVIKLKTERMAPTAELAESKEEVTNRLKKLLPRILEGLKPKPSEMSTEVDRRIAAIETVEQQMSALKRIQLTDDIVTGAMAKVMAQLRNEARGAETMSQRSLRTLQMYWDSLLRKDTHWQIRRAINSMGECQRDEEGKTDNLKMCMNGVVAKMDRHIDDIGDWFKDQRPIDMEDWKWLVEIRLLVNWK